MEIALYYAPITCALAPYITLTEAGAKFEVRPLNFRKGQHTSPEYLKINPKHKVPLLIVDGKVLSESVANAWRAASVIPRLSGLRKMRPAVRRNFRTAGGRVVALEGAEPPKRVAITEWDSLEQAQAFYNSKAFKDLAPQRDKAIKIIRQFVVEAAN